MPANSDGPPLATKRIKPLLSAQVGSATESAAIKIGVGSLTTAVSRAIQPAESCTVKMYVPANKLLIVSVPGCAGDHTMV